MASNPLLSSIQYHDYGVFISHMDSEPNRWDENDEYANFYIRPNKEFTAGCIKYLNGIIDNDKKINKGIEDNTPLSFLYNPASFITFGNTDNISLVAIDDFDIAVYLTSNINIPVMQTTLAFCPTLRSLNIDKTKKPFLCEIDDVCNGNKEPDKKYGIIKHQFLEDRPLVAFNYFRLSGLAVLGPGLLFLKEILLEMIKRIQSILKNIKPEKDLVSKSDIESFRCLFLDPQGWADVATVMFCSNYTVIAQVLKELRKISFYDLYERKGAIRNQNHLQKAVKEFGFHRKIVEIENKYRSEKKIKEGDYNLALGSNHIFSATHTTAGISHEVFTSDQNEQSKKIFGQVSANPSFNFSPGHLDDIWKLDILKSKSNSNSQNFVLNKDWHFISFGQFDTTQKSLAAPQQMELIPLYELVTGIKRLLGLHQKQIANPNEHWPIKRVCTDIHVPIKNKKNQKNAEGSQHNHINIRPILGHLRKYLFQNISPKGGGFISPLSIPLLKTAIRELRIPSPLSSGIIYLFTDYANCIGDPNLFDNVLDLHDTFAAFHRIITREMRLELKDFIKDYSSNPTLQETKRLSYLSADKIQNIKTIIDLLENALHHRTHMNYPANDWWNRVIDFKGEINKLINAADVPLKCGLSIVRRIIDEEIKLTDKPEILITTSKTAQKYLKNENKEEKRFRVGGTSKLTYNTSIMNRRFKIGHSEINFLVYLSLNVGHLIKPEILYAHLHEIGHIVNDLMQRKKRTYPRDLYCKNECDGDNCFRIIDSNNNHPEFNVAKRHRNNEIFSEMLACGMVFANFIDDGSAFSFKNKKLYRGYNGIKSYFRFIASMYSLHPISLSGDSDKILLKMSEIFSRAFLASDPFTYPKSSNNGNKDLYAVRSGYELSKRDIDRAVKRFTDILEECAPLFYDFTRYWKIPKCNEYIINHFKETYYTSFKSVCCMWEHVREILTGIFFGQETNHDSFGTNPNPDDHFKLINAMKRCYQDGKPIIRLLYRDSREERYKDPELLSHLDSIFVVCNMLRIHINEIYGKMDIDKQVCYFRNNKSDKEANYQLVDKFEGGLFSTNFKQRQKYLQNRISVIKTFWDLSTNINGRTFNQFLDQFLKELEI